VRLQRRFSSAFACLPALGRKQRSGERPQSKRSAKKPAALEFAPAFGVRAPSAPLSGVPSISRPIEFQSRAKSVRLQPADRSAGLLRAAISNSRNATWRLPIGLPQRGNVTKPRVGPRNEDLPWVVPISEKQPQRGCVVALLHADGRNPVGVAERNSRYPG
jgi:hypothetical protein